jgi:hypothetical protein
MPSFLAPVLDRQCKASQPKDSMTVSIDKNSLTREKVHSQRWQYFVISRTQKNQKRIRHSAVVFIELFSSVRSQENYGYSIFGEMYKF